MNVGDMVFDVKHSHHCRGNVFFMERKRDTEMRKEARQRNERLPCNASLRTRNSNCGVDSSGDFHRERLRADCECLAFTPRRVDSTRWLALMFALYYHLPLAPCLCRHYAPGMCRW